MGQPVERGNGGLDQPMAGFVVQTRNQAEATAVAFERLAVQPAVGFTAHRRGPILRRPSRASRSEATGYRAPRAYLLKPCDSGGRTGNNLSALGARRPRYLQHQIPIKYTDQSRAVNGIGALGRPAGVSSGALSNQRTVI